MDRVRRSPREDQTTKNKKPAVTKNATAGVGGGEGNRTPVQTYPSKAFYMLISSLIVGLIQGMNKPILTLAE